MARRIILTKYLEELEAKRRRRCDQLEEDEISIVFMLTRQQEGRNRFQSVTINHLPETALKRIFGYLSTKDLLKARLTSRRWYELADCLIEKSSSALIKQSEHLSLSLTGSNREIMV